MSFAIYPHTMNGTNLEFPSKQYPTVYEDSMQLFMGVPIGLVYYAMTGENPRRMSLDDPFDTIDDCIEAKRVCQMYYFLSVMPYESVKGVVDLVNVDCLNPVLEAIIVATTPVGVVLEKSETFEVDDYSREVIKTVANVDESTILCKLTTSTVLHILSTKFRLHMYRQFLVLTNSCFDDVVTDLVTWRGVYRENGAFRKYMWVEVLSVISAANWDLTYSQLMEKVKPSGTIVSISIDSMTDALIEEIDEGTDEDGSE